MIRFAHSMIRFAYARIRFAHARIRFAHARIRFAYARIRFAYAGIRFAYAGVFLASLLALAACGAQPDGLTTREAHEKKVGKVFGDLEFGSGVDNRKQANTNRARRPGVIVEGSEVSNEVTVTGTLANPYLWRASLDVIDFMPIRQVDPISGIIITDWYEFPEQPGTRYKVDIRVLGRTLRADYLTVSVFKEQRDSVRDWQVVAVDPETRLQLEETIITKARELKQSSGQ